MTAYFEALAILIHRAGGEVTFTEEERGNIPCCVKSVEVSRDQKTGNIKLSLKYGTIKPEDRMNK